MGQTAEDIRDNIVKIVDGQGRCVGTGFFVQKECCVTCHHNIWQLDDIFIERDIEVEGGEQKKHYHAEWIEDFSDMQKDIAVLKVQNADFKPLRCHAEVYSTIP